MEIYSMPRAFLEDKNVAVKWKLYGLINGFWLNGRTVYAANKYFAEQLKCSERAIRAALEELEKDKVLTRNINGHNRTILPYGKVVEAEAQLPGGGSPASGEAEAQLPPNASSIASNKTSVATAPQLEYVPENARPPKESKAKYPHSKEVFSWFPEPEPSWAINTTELKHAELLWARGEADVKKALVYHHKHKDDEGYGYKVVKPSDLERKWNDIKDYARRNK